MAEKQTAKTTSSEASFEDGEKRPQKTSSDSAMPEAVTSSDGGGPVQPPPSHLFDLEPVSMKKVIKAQKWPSINSRRVYPMKSSPRGHALIINNEKFESEENRERKGSSVDAKNLEGMLTELGFIVTLKTNLKRSEMHDEIKKFSLNPGHSTADMCIVTVLSHGKENDEIYCSDNFTINTKEIFSQFNNINCKALLGKPKLFIIQACRGDETDHGITKNISDSDDEDEENALMGRSESDMLIVYSTVPGYTSIRDHVQGSWLVQSITDVFSENAKDTDIREMLDMVSVKVAKFQSERREVMSCTHVTRNFTKKLFFNPGLSEKGS